MKTPILKYTSDQLKAIALLTTEPRSCAQLVEYFPGKTKHQIASMLRNPRDVGKIFINSGGKYEVFTLPPGLRVIKGKPMPYSAPLRREQILWESDRCL